MDKHIFAKEERNYELDFLKLVFAVIVFSAHTIYLVPKGADIPKTPVFSGGGYISVQFFFSVSGLLMVDSYMRKWQSDERMNHGELAFRLVLRKYKQIAAKYFVALMIALFTYILVYGDAAKTIVKAIPEILMLEESGVYHMLANGPTWYLSAMMIGMLFLGYILVRNNDFYIHVFAPLTAIMTLGYLYNVYPKIEHNFNGVFLETVTRSICGLCFGAVAWKIGKYLEKNIMNHLQKIAITFVEIVMYLTIFVSLFLWGDDSEVLHSILLVIPLALAISFSKSSYVWTFFNNKIFKLAAPLSLAIYLNHDAAKRIVVVFFSSMSYFHRILAMIIVTAAMIVIYFGILRLMNKLWSSKLRRLWFNFRE